MTNGTTASQQQPVNTSLLSLQQLLAQQQQQQYLALGLQQQYLPQQHDALNGTIIGTQGESMLRSCLLIFSVSLQTWVVVTCPSWLWCLCFNNNNPLLSQVGAHNNITPSDNLCIIAGSLQPGLGLQYGAVPGVASVQGVQGTTSPLTMSTPAVSSLVQGYSPATDQASYMQPLNLNTLTAVTAASNLNSLAAAATAGQQPAVNNNNTLAYLATSAVAGNASSHHLSWPYHRWDSNNCQILLIKLKYRVHLWFFWQHEESSSLKQHLKAISSNPLFNLFLLLTSSNDVSIWIRCIL